MEDDAIDKIMFFHKCLELRGFVVVDDVQLEVVALLPQPLDGAQDAAEVLGFVAQGGDVEHLFF